MVCLAFVLGLALAGHGHAWGQAKKQPNPFQGFSSDSGQPVDVKSETLEVYQNEQKAIFIGNVVAKQGDSTLRSARLTVFYDNASSGGKGSAPTQASSIKKLEATGGVVVTSADQKATGASGVFDMASNTATLTGDVVLTQGPNVIRGKTLVVDLKTGLARVVGGTSGLFVPSHDQQVPGAAKPKPK
jgi:lipopolysaccharide export system protein LptA